jgi:hypothetical protein
LDKFCDFKNLIHRCFFGTRSDIDQNIFLLKKLNEFGFLKGIFAFKNRVKKCRGGYEIYTGQNGFEMKLTDGSIIMEEEISLNIMRSIYKNSENSKHLK